MVVIGGRRSVSVSKECRLSRRQRHQQQQHHQDYCTACITKLKRRIKSSTITILISLAFLIATFAISFSVFSVHTTISTSNTYDGVVTVDRLDDRRTTLSSSLLYFGHNNPESVSTVSKVDDHSHKSNSKSSSSVNSNNNRIAGTTSIRRYDDAGPKGIKGTARSHSLPNAIPMTRQIPLSQAENRTYHLLQRTNTSIPTSIYPAPRKKNKNKNQDKFPSTDGKYNWNHDYSNDYRTLYLYNPSILPLHNTIDDDDDTTADNYDALSKSDLMELTGGDTKIRYVVTYRAYLSSNCFGPDPTKREMMTAGEQVSYIAIALLDENLDIIDNTDVVIDLNAGPSRGLYFRQWAEDCRIFCMKKSLWLLCNEQFFMVQIQRRDSNDKSTTTENVKYGTKNDTTIPYIYPNIYGNGLQVTVMAHNSKISGGKNFNLFRTVRTSTMGRKNSIETNSTVTVGDDGGHMHHSNHYIQLLSIPHQYRQMNLPDKHRPPIRRSYQDDIRHVYNDVEGKPAFREQEVLGIQSSLLPRPSFYTPDSQHNISTCDDDNGGNNCTNPSERSFFEANTDHGTACCVKVILPIFNQQQQQREVFVGISHQKLSKRNNFWLKDTQKRYEHLGPDRFVSRFVAYETTVPFEIVAISGWFCLGFASEEENRGGGNGENNDSRHNSKLNSKSTLASFNINNNTKLDLFNTTYNCPIIHFASGFSEVVGNSSQAIIGYGINDCHPRMFKVEKEEIIRLLLNT